MTSRLPLDRELAFEMIRKWLVANSPRQSELRKHALKGVLNSAYSVDRVKQLPDDALCEIAAALGIGVLPSIKTTLSFRLKPVRLRALGSDLDVLVGRGVEDATETDSQNESGTDVGASDSENESERDVAPSAVEQARDRLRAARMARKVQMDRAAENGELWTLYATYGTDDTTMVLYQGREPVESFEAFIEEHGLDNTVILGPSHLAGPAKKVRAEAVANFGGAPWAAVTCHIITD